MKYHKTTFILKAIITSLIVINSFHLFSQDNCDLLTYTLYHKAKGEKIYVSGFDSAANYSPSYNELLLFIKNNTIYQLDEKGNHIQGKVYASFIVEKNGLISDIKVIKSLSTSCDKEAIRVLSILPNKWRPAIKNGKPVRSQFNLSISFS